MIGVFWDRDGARRRSKPLPTKSKSLMLHGLDYQPQQERHASLSSDDKGSKPLQVVRTFAGPERHFTRCRAGHGDDASRRERVGEEHFPALPEPPGKADVG